MTKAERAVIQKAKAWRRAVARATVDRVRTGTGSSAKDLAELDARLRLLAAVTRLAKEGK